MPDQTYRLTTPTLLIGLGGLGCSIVQEVFDGLDEETRKYTRAHVLDTDGADLKDERYDSLRTNRWQTQTSRKVTVHECVQQLDVGHVVSRWFPAVSAGSLLHKQMTKGAAQIRAISRLAWLDTLSSNRIDALNANLDRLFLARADGLSEAARVMIVNSIAGGTGTGLFLQMALYVREYFRQRGTTALTIRGFAVLPEVFISNRDYESEDLRLNVRANGYAVLKEVDALVRLRAGAYSEPARSHMAPFYELGLEYVPGQKTPTAVVAGMPPFDVITLFDFTNSNGGNLGSKSNYIAQVQDAMRLHLFSPLEGRGGPDSQEDNLANTHLSHGDRSRYAGCGTANVVYPFESLVEYAALRWANDGISSEWTELDRLITDEIQAVERARREGNQLEMPDRHTRFGQLLRDKGTAPRPVRLYRAVYGDTQLLDDKGAPVAAKHELWLKALERKAKQVTEAAVAEKQDQLSQISMEALKDRDNVVSQVEQSEDGLRTYAQEVEKRVQPIGAALAKEAVWRPFDTSTEFIKGDETQLNTWLLAKDRAMHPLAMRYFLVESRLWLRKRLGELKHDLKAANDAVDGYEASWDDPATDQVESAADVARTRRDKWIGRFTGELKRFAEDYWAISEGQRINIESRAELYVLAEMFDLLLAYVEDLADSWQQWFLNLEQVSRQAKDRVALLEAMHDRSDDPTRVYVHASAAIKRKMWDEQSAQVAAMEFPPDVAREMYLALYRDLGETIRNETAAERPSGWVQELFDRSVLKWCQAQLRASPAFDMDVSAAIKSEWRMLRQAGGADAPSTEDEAMMAYLGRIDSLATPWIDAGGKGQPFTYLCMHPDAAAKWSDKLLNQHARKRNVHAGFSRYRISRMAVLQALCATDLRSMVGEHATYRSAYDLRVQRSRARPPAAVTPHLDFHWDSPAFLPELDDAEQARAIRDIYRAALLTLADLAAATSTQVFRMKLDLRQVWAWSPTRGVETALHDKDGHSVLADTYRLVDVLATNYGLVRQIVAIAAEHELQMRAEPDKSNLIGRLGELVDAIARVPQEAHSAAAGAQRQSALLQALFDEVYEIYHRASGLPDSARLAAQGTLQGIWQWSSALNADSTSDFAALVRRSVDNALQPRSS